VEALVAGVDQLLMPVNLAGTVTALVRALEDGRLPMARLDQACLRVLRLKERLGLLAGSFLDPPAGDQHTTMGAGQAGAVELAARAVTVLGAPFVAPSSQRPWVVVGAEPVAGQLRAALQARGAALMEDERTAHAAVVIVTSDLRSAAQLSEARQLLAADPNAILVVTGSPYGVQAVPGPRTVLVTYGSTPVHIEGLAMALTDPTRPPSGRLPVSLQGRLL
jgi:beta-N-acetylhexosaminidase